jgi:metal-dependent amidase/aminoacylase/carboxypeptidase family protein
LEVSHNLELGNEEHKALEKLTSFLEEHNFEIEKNSKTFNKNLRELGITDINGPKDAGSSDIGNVSHKTATIHPYIGTLAPAYTGYDVLTNKVDLKE